MKRFIEGQDRSQSTLLPESLDDYVAEDNPVRVIEVFVDGLDLAKLGFEGAVPKATGRPAYHPATLLKIYVYGYLNRIQSSRRLERETQRNLELIWLSRRLTPDFKTIADFRKDNGAAIRRVCGEFIALYRNLNLFSEAIVANQPFSPSRDPRRRSQDPRGHVAARQGYRCPCLPMEDVMQRKPIENPGSCKVARRMVYIEYIPI
jgi:transposase